MSPDGQRFAFLLLFCFFLGVLPPSLGAEPQWSVELVFDEVDDTMFYLDYPVAVLVTEADGLVYVSDWGNNRLVVFDQEGNTQRVIDDLAGPTGLALDPDSNRLYVVEQRANRVAIMDRQTHTVVGYLEAQNPSFQEPRGIAIDRAGQIYVVDTNRSRVVVFDREGRELFSFGREGMADQEFYYPRGIAVDKRGRIWIADTVHHSVKIFDRDGNFLTRFGQGGSEAEDFNRVRYVSIRNDYAFITDYNNHRLKIYDLDGTLVEIVGSRGTGRGQFVTPEGVWADHQGQVWIADAGNSRIQKMNFSHLIDQETHLSTLLEEGRIEELLSLAGNKREDPAYGRLLYEAYQKKGNTDQMLHQAEILWETDQENRDYWKKALGRLYYQQASAARGNRPLGEVRDLYQKSYDFGNRRALLFSLWMSFLLMGGSAVTLILLGVLLFVLIIVFYRLKTSRFRR